MPSTDASKVIPKFKETFSRFGSPEILMTDNGPPFSSVAFNRFYKWSIRHSTSSPRYPQSNGHIERHLQTIKNILKKTTEAGQEQYLALQNWRNTPRNSLPSPAQLCMGRNIRSTLPCKSSHYHQCQFRREDIQQQLEQNQNKMSMYYDRGSVPLNPLRPSTQVLVHTGKEWSPATVVKPLNEPRSYLIEDSHGQQYRRNRVHLKPNHSPRKAAQEKGEEKQENGKEETEEKEEGVISKEKDFQTPTRKTSSGRIIKTPVRLNL
ncbi:uncharacterized protein LOC111633771 [Centruroides sculpturatus]|uniref:uncharacterized protein LOC111633771 n=1 Tax=Centruroides sculpturatus TaxID=218467 RepID=UPI000C6E1D15|nr:uncharacterized protein LOC111633771 [Centruroides sculpturatus]